MKCLSNQTCYNVYMQGVVPEIWTPKADSNRSAPSNAYIEPQRPKMIANIMLASIHVFQVPYTLNGSFPK